MIKFGVHGAQASFDIPKAFAISQLGKSQAKKLFEARKLSYSVIAMITVDTFVELVLGHIIYQLG